MSGAALEGRLPDSWAGGGAFPALRRMHLEGNRLEGTLPPDTWGSASAFPALQYLGLRGNVKVCGGVPERLVPAVCGPFNATLGGAAAAAPQCKPVTDSQVPHSLDCLQPDAGAWAVGAGSAMGAVVACVARWAACKPA